MYRVGAAIGLTLTEGEREDEDPRDDLLHRNVGYLWLPEKDNRGRRMVKEVNEWRLGGRQWIASIDY